MAINKVIYGLNGEQIVDTEGHVTVYGVDGTSNRVNKVVYGQNVLIDITDTTAEAEHVVRGYVIHKKDGSKVTGTATLTLVGDGGTVEDDTYIPGEGGGGETWETEYDSIVTVVADNPNYIAINNYGDPINANETYRVTYDGDAYVFETEYSSTIGGYYFGNPGVINPSSDDGSGATFLFYKRTSTQLVAVTTDSPGQVAVMIEKKVSGSSISLQSKTVTPTTSQQIVTADSGYDGLDTVTVDPIPSQYIVPSGTKQIIANGTGIDVTNYASVDVAVPTGPDKNVQHYIGYDEVNTTSYEATDVSLTVAKTGTYKVSWMGWRSNGSGSWGTQLYVGDTAYGSAVTTFTRSYGQSVVLSNVSLTQGQTITVRAKSRGSSYYMIVGNLIIEEQ